MSDPAKPAEPRRVVEGIVHGTCTGYNYHGCRCDACKESRRVYRADWRARSGGVLCATLGCRNYPSVVANNGYCATCNHREPDAWDGAMLLRRAMKARGLRQRDLAAEIGTSTQQVNNLVRGQRNLTVRHALEIERVLGISAQILLYLSADAQLERAREAAKGDSGDS